MKEKKQFGLIGRNIDYSFSRNYFTKKFSATETLSNYEYVNFDIESVEEVTSIFKQKNIYGLNVTIPYKESIIKYLMNLIILHLKLDLLIQYVMRIKKK